VFVHNINTKQLPSNCIQALDAKKAHTAPLIERSPVSS